jgi:hypothetical protein
VFGKNTQIASRESPWDQVFSGKSSGKYLPKVKQLAQSQQGIRAASRQTKSSPISATPKTPKEAVKRKIAAQPQKHILRKTHKIHHH